MKHHLLLFSCIVTLVGAFIAAPNDMMMPLIIKKEIERMKSGVNLISSGIEKPINFSACSTNPEEDMTTIDMILKSGYPAEEHFVTTDDGYILTLHRIPGDKKSPTVLLHHAVLESSFCWVISGKGKALAFMLADAGYDVWMANARGNTYSKNHTSMSPTNPEFWNFSWHEMGMYDVPAEIKYITSMKNDKLMYVGHSMGTTMFYVMASKRPEVASKVKAMFGFAPVAFTEHIRGPFWVIGSMLRSIEKSTKFHGHMEFFSQSAMFKFTAKCLCTKPYLKEICRSVIFSTVGFNTDQFNTTLLPVILTHTPAGTSLKTLLHYAQGISSKKFRHYDYGAEMNLKIYKSEWPPEYDFSKIQVPITLFWSQNDYLAQPEDVQRLYDMLPRKVMHKIDDPHFNHLDFLWALNAPDQVYSKLLASMEEYR